MSTTLDKPIRYNGELYCGAKEIGFRKSGSFVVSLWRCPPPEPRGELFVVIPISPVDYRKQHPTRAAVEWHEDSLVLHGDRGDPYTIKGDPGLLAHLLRECREQAIPVYDFCGPKAQPKPPSKLPS